MTNSILYTWLHKKNKCNVILHCGGLTAPQKLLLQWRPVGLQAALVSKAERDFLFCFYQSENQEVFGNPQGGSGITNLPFSLWK